MSSGTLLLSNLWWLGLLVSNSCMYSLSTVSWLKLVWLKIFLTGCSSDSAIGFLFFIFNWASNNFFLFFLVFKIVIFINIIGLVRNEVSRIFKVFFLRSFTVIITKFRIIFFPFFIIKEFHFDLIVGTCRKNVEKKAGRIPQCRS